MSEIVRPPSHNSYGVTVRRWIAEGRCISCGSDDVPLARDRWGNVLPRRIRPLPATSSLVCALQAPEPPMSAVDHPSHYNAGNIEVIDAIEDWNLNFSLGNAVKYIARADHKGASIEDLQKAAWYLNREIQRRQKAAGA
jgi:hypothetical protein